LIISLQVTCPPKDDEEFPDERGEAPDSTQPNTNTFEGEIPMANTLCVLSNKMSASSRTVLLVLSSSQDKSVAEKSSPQPLPGNPVSKLHDDAATYIKAIEPPCKTHILDSDRSHEEATTKLVSKSQSHKMPANSTVHNDSAAMERGLEKLKNHIATLYKENKALIKRRDELETTVESFREEKPRASRETETTKTRFDAEIEMENTRIRIDALCAENRQLKSEKKGLERNLQIVRQETDLELESARRQVEAYKNTLHDTLYSKCKVDIDQDDEQQEFWDVDEYDEQNEFWYEMLSDAEHETARAVKKAQDKAEADKIALLQAHKEEVHRIQDECKRRMNLMRKEHIRFLEKSRANFKDEARRLQVLDLDYWGSP
jgi:hypothetical protein